MRSRNLFNLGGTMEKIIVKAITLIIALSSVMVFLTGCGGAGE